MTSVAPPLSSKPVNEPRDNSEGRRRHEGPCREPLSAPPPEIRARLGRIRHVLLDLDGTLYLDECLFDSTLPFLSTLERLGIGRGFLTNNNSRSTSDSLAKLVALGIPARPGEVYTSTLAAVEFVRERMPGARRAFVLGTPALRREIREAGFEETEDDPDDEPDLVLVGFDATLTHARLSRAAWWVSRGKPFVATHPDRICPTRERTVLIDCGSICAAIEHATGRRPLAVPGKPDPRMIEGAIRGRGLVREDVALVGDRLYTDMRMARDTGALAVLVLSGETTREEAEARPEAADIVVADVGAFGTLLERARGNS